MLRIAVTGTGMIVNEILPVLKKMKEIDLAALCCTPRSLETGLKLQSEYEIPELFTDFDEMLASETIQLIDVVYLGVPNATHLELASKALNAGKHVFIEKPMTPREEDSKKLVALAREKRLFLVEAVTNKFLPAYDLIKEYLPKIGDIKYADFNFSQYSSKFDRFLAGEYFRVFDPALDGGALMDMNVYNLHLAAGLFGKPLSTEYHYNLMRGCDTSGIVTLQYPDFICTCMGTKDSQGPSRVLIQGVRGYLQLITPPNQMLGPLYYYDQTTKTQTIIPVPETMHRIESEFQAMDAMIHADDYERCLASQDDSLIVASLLSQARSFLPPVCKK